MRKLYLLLLTLLLICCRSGPGNIHPDTDTQFPASLLAQGLNNIDSFIYEGKNISIYNPYKNKGELELKGAMHNHSSNSWDSIISPYDAGVKFRDEGGYDFYSLTDHNFVSFDPNVPGIIWMGNSLEDSKYSINAQHLNIYNLPENYKYKNKGSNMGKLFNYYKSLGAIVCLNHPESKIVYQSNEKLLSSPEVDFVEVINNEPFSERSFDLLLSRGARVFGMASNDYHLKRKDETVLNSGYIIAFTDKKEKESIWQSLLTGAFYMVFNNARMDISCENGIIKANTYQPSKIEFIGLNTETPERGIVLYSVQDSDEASYQITGTEGYVRVRITNEDGAALSQAFVIIDNE